MHLDEEHVQRLLHGELAPAAATTVSAHLARCAECRLAVATAEGEEERMQGLLPQLDHPFRRLDARTVVAAACTPERRWGRWVAGVILALGLGGASYAIPGSPIPSLVRSVVQWAGSRTDSRRPVSVPAPEPAPAAVSDPSAAGIAMPPGRELVIHFTEARGQARVSLTDGVEVKVRASAGAATFIAHVDRLVIENQGAETLFDIEIPRSAARVEIRVAERRVFLKEGSRVEAPAEPRVIRPDATQDEGAYLLQLTPPSP